MRLVDADALKAEFDKNCAMECACCDNATCNHVRNAVGCGLVDAAPTIDAIPVEWLKNRREGMIFAAMTNSQVYGNNTIELCHAVNVVLDMWREEQEART